MALKVSGLDHLVLTVADIAASVRFYQEALGMVAQRFSPADGSQRWAVTFGDQKINLHQVGAEFEPKARNATAGAADLCFMSPHPVTQWQAHLADLGIEVIDGPVRRSGATGPILSLYLRDPDGNLIEISQPL